MADVRDIPGRDRAGLVAGVVCPPGRAAGGDAPAAEPGGPPPRVTVIERTAIARFAGAEFLVEAAAVRAACARLARLADEAQPTRLVLNFRGVRYLSSEVLGELVALQKQVGDRGGRARLCGLDPLLRDILRVTRLDGVFDLCTDEAEALGLLPLDPGVSSARTPAPCREVAEGEATP
jgi:anti-sigma B factor antagonist